MINLVGKDFAKAAYGDPGTVQHRRDRPNRNNRNGGVRNVYRDKGRWRAEFSHNGIQVHVGSFGTLAEAEAAVRKARAGIAVARDAV